MDVHILALCVVEELLSSRWFNKRHTRRMVIGSEVYLEKSSPSNRISHIAMGGTFWQATDLNCTLF